LPGIALIVAGSVAASELVTRILIDGVPIDGLAGIRKVHRGQEIRHSHAGVQHLNKISRGYAVALGDVQHFNDGTFYKVSVGLCGLFSIIHCPPYRFCPARMLECMQLRLVNNAHF
jgi:hypothetical protein